MVGAGGGVGRFVGGGRPKSIGFPATRKPTLAVIGVCQVGLGCGTEWLEGTGVLGLGCGLVPVPG